MIWDQRMLSPELVFYCLFCARKHGLDFEVRGSITAGMEGLIPVPQFKLRIDHYPRKTDIWFRYDPPVLIVAATLHKEPDSFCRLLRQHIGLCYRGNATSVCTPVAIHWHAHDYNLGEALGG